MEVKDIGIRVKKEFKQTEVGVIPADWEFKSLNDISKPVRGGSPRPAGSPKYFNGSYIPWLTVASLTNIPTAQISVSETDSFLTKEGSMHSRTLEKGTPIIANSGATLGVAKLLAIKCCANDGIAALLDFDKHVDKTYVVYFLNSITRRLREVVATGNGQPNLNTELIGNIQIPLPPTKAEQTAIATVLSDTDALVSRLETLIEKKRAIKQGAMQQLLKPKEGWVVKKLGEVCDVRDGTHDSPKYIDNGVLFITSKNIVNSKIDFEDVSFISYEDANQINQRSKVDKSDIIMSMIGTIGNAVLVDIEPNFCIKNVALIKPKKLNSEYLIQLINSPSFQTYLINKLDGGIQKFISLSVLRGLEVNIPPKHEQTRIAKILSDMDAEVTGLEQKLSKYKLVKQGMMQELLTGKTRLVASQQI